MCPDGSRDVGIWDDGWPSPSPPPCEGVQCYWSKRDPNARPERDTISRAAAFAEGVLDLLMGRLPVFDVGHAQPDPAQSAPPIETGESFVEQDEPTPVPSTDGAGSRRGNKCGEDPAKRRPKLRKGTKDAIRDAAPKDGSGNFVDPNTGRTVPAEGPFDYGHKPGMEWWRTRDRAREEGWLRSEVIEHENDPAKFQIEDPSSNRSHKFEEC